MKNVLQTNLNVNTISYKMNGEKLTTIAKNTDAIFCPSDSVDLNKMTEEQRKRYEHSCNTLINAAREVISESKKRKEGE